MEENLDFDCIYDLSKFSNFLFEHTRKCKEIYDQHKGTITNVADIYLFKG